MNRAGNPCRPSSFGPLRPRLDSLSNKLDNTEVKQTRRSRHQLSKKALPLFFFGILVSTFVGGAVRAFFSPRQIELWVSTTLEKEQPPIHLSFAKGSLSLSHRFIPRLGLVFEQVHIRPNDYCKVNADLFIEQLYLPIQVLDFFKGKLKFRQIEISKAELSLEAGTCESSPVAIAEVSNPVAPVLDAKAKSTAGAEVAVQEKIKPEIVAAINFFHTRWPKEMKNTSDRVQGLKVLELKIRKGEQPIALVKDLDVDTSTPEEFHLISHFEVHRLQGLVESVDPTRLEVDIDPEVLKFRLTEQIREGRVLASGEVLLSNLLFTAKTEFSNVPTRPVFDFIVRNGWSENNLNWPRQSWVNGVARLSGAIENLSDTRVQFDEWKFDGDLGKASLKSFTFRPLKDEAWGEPLKIKFTKLKVDPTIELLGITRLNGMFQSYGNFEGELVAVNPKQWELSGVWSKLVLKFSRFKVRGTQELSFSSQLLLKDERISGQISEVKLRGGEFDGKLSFNVSRDGVGPFQIEVPKFGFSPKVEKLMLGGVAEGLEIYGQGHLKNWQVDKWEGAVGLAAIKGASWSALGVKVHSQLQHSDPTPLRMNFNMTAKELQIASTHPYYPELKPLYLDQEMKDESLLWSGLQTRAVLENKNLSWSKAMVKDSRRKIIFSSEGSWSALNGVEGWISVDFPVLKLLKWDLSGTPQAIRLQPSAVMLKELARRNPNFNIQSYLPPQKVKQERQLEAIGEKVIETAKKILPAPKSKTEEN